MPRKIQPNPALSTRCPCCGQNFKNARLLVSLEFNTAFAGERCVSMPPTAAEIVYAILEVFPVPLHAARIRQRVFPTSRMHSVESTLRTQIYVARKHLEKIGYTIKHESGRGYHVVKL